MKILIILLLFIAILAQIVSMVIDDNFKKNEGKDERGEKILNSGYAFSFKLTATLIILVTVAGNFTKISSNIYASILIILYAVMVSAKSFYIYYFKDK